MYCQKCGKEIPENTAFCQACGTKVSDGGNGQTDASAKKTEAKSKKLSKKAKIIIGVICAFILLLILLFSVDDGSWDQITDPNGSFNFDPVTEQTTEELTTAEPAV